MSEPERMFGWLLDASHRLSLEYLPALVRKHAAQVGLRGALIYLADLQEDVLRLVSGGGVEAGAAADGQEAELRIDSTAAGRAYATLEPVCSESDEAGYWWWAPLLNGAERIGVLRVWTDENDSQTSVAVQRLASLVTLLLISVRSQSDSYARLVRSKRMTLAAELQWNLMPPLAFANGQVTVSAALEPAYEIGGDAFDYALSDDVMHLGLFDAMGHDVAAGLTANLAVAAARNARRQNATLIETGEFIERTLIDQLKAERYVTALLAELDTRTGKLTWISHGHQPPVVFREGTWRELLHCPPSHPLGTDLGVEVTVCEQQLRPGDRLVLYTDGVTEARGADGTEFGLDRFLNFILTHNAAGLPVPETLRRLIHSVLEYQKGQLQDDTTVLFLEWHGPQERQSGTVERLLSHPDERVTLL